MNNEIVILKGKATADQIADWKKLYNNEVWEIAAPVGDSGKTAYAYFHRPSRASVDAASRHTSEPGKFITTIFNHTCIAYDAVVMQDDQVYMSIRNELAEVVTPAKAEIKKL